VTDLTLYVDARLVSPYAMSAFVALEEKQLPYSLKTLSLPDKEHHTAAYRAATGRIPSLVHGDYWLAESTAIAEYLAETFPFPNHPRIFPEDLKERGVCRMIQAWVRSDLMPIREERSTDTVFLRRADTPLSAAAKAQVERLLRAVEPLIGDRPTLFKQWCIADCDLAVMLQRLNLNGDPLPQKVKAYAEAAWQRPSIQKWCGLKRASAVR
jgi:glutathione S-transferase